MHEFVNLIPALHSIQADRKCLLRLAISLWVVVSLGACSGMRDLPVTTESHANWAMHQVHLGKINSWDIHARSVINIAEEVYQIGINWQQESDLFVFVIEAPFGQGVFRIENNLQAHGEPPIKLSMPDGQVYYDETAEALLIKVLGWSIPVKGLKSWIKGLPQRGTDFRYELQADGRLKSLRQEDWSINYLEYFAFDSAAQGLPRKMYLKHANLSLKIVIERWHQIESKISPTGLFPEFD